MKTTHRQTGSAHVAIIMILVVAILGLLGYVFWQNFIFHKSVVTTAKVDASTSTATNVSEATSGAQVVAQTPAYTLDDAVAGINLTLSTQACDGKYSATLSKGGFKQVSNTEAFKYQGGVSIINNDFTYTYVQYGCSSSGEVSLLKRVDNTWKLISKDARIYPMCDLVRDQGFPISVVDKCYVDNNATDPVAI